VPPCCCPNHAEQRFRNVPAFHPVAPANGATAIAATQPDGGDPAFTLAAPDTVWAKFLLPVPPRHHHGIFALHYRVAEFAVQSDQLVFMQHAQFEVAGVV
jgi:hypothetical protein